MQGMCESANHLIVQGQRLKKLYLKAVGTLSFFGIVFSPVVMEVTKVSETVSKTFRRKTCESIPVYVK